MSITKYYKGSVGKKFWLSNKDRPFIKAFLKYVEDGGRTFTGCDCYNHTIDSIFLSFSTKTNLSFSYDNSLSEYEDDMVSSPEYLKIIDEVLNKHKGKEYSLDSLMVLGTDGKSHFVDRHYCASSPDFSSTKYDLAKPDEVNLESNKNAHIKSFETVYDKIIIKELDWIKIYKYYYTSTS